MPVPHSSIPRKRSLDSHLTERGRLIPQEKLEKLELDPQLDPPDPKYASVRSAWLFSVAPHLATFQYGLGRCGLLARYGQRVFAW